MSSILNGNESSRATKPLTYLLQAPTVVITQMVYSAEIGWKFWVARLPVITGILPAIVSSTSPDAQVINRKAIL